MHLLVHPDYLCTGDRLAAYEEFLGFLSQQERGWHALPKEVAHWWKARAGLRCESAPGEDPRIVGEPRDGATVAYAREESDRIAFDI